jgi:hypothetical protein
VIVTGTPAMPNRRAPYKPGKQQEVLMSKRSIIAAVMSFFFLATVVAMAATPPDVVKLEAKQGVVTFKHADHGKKIGADKCNTCHHGKKPDGSDAQKCSACHGAAAVEKDGKKIPSAKDAFHKVCKDCHTKGAKGPTKCTECHVKPATP